MTFVIVERNIGRAGTRKQSLEKQKIWNQKYGEGNWKTGYEFEGKFITREEAIEKIYYPSYFKFLDEHPEVVQEILEYEKVFNPHAYFTNSVDIQAVAIEEYLKQRNLSCKGNKKFLAIGVWQPRNNKESIFKEAKEMGIRNNSEKLLYPKASYALSPFKIMCWHNSNLSVEAYWQSEFKVLAVRK